MKEESILVEARKMIGKKVTKIDLVTDCDGGINISCEDGSCLRVSVMWGDFQAEFSPKEGVK